MRKLGGFTKWAVTQDLKLKALGEVLYTDVLN